MSIVIIDGNSLINRAYYALQRPMITKSGLYTHGVYGFLNMLNKITTDYDPQYMLVAFDKKAPTFRHLEYAEYKAGRKKMPPELAMQLPLLKDVLAAMKIKMMEMEGFEADDIIGTVAREAENQGLEPLIITGDKDELQLATKVTKVLITKKGISEFELYDEDAMVETYGFGPEQFIDYKGLMGDASDNIPGIPGVGEKTAQKLILEFGSVANLIENLDQVSNKKLKEKIEEHAQLAIMSRRLATINTAVPLDIHFEEFKVEEPDYAALIELYIKLEFNSLLKKLKTSADYQAALPEKTAALSVSEQKDIKKEMVSTEEALSAMAEGLQKNPSIILKVFNDENHKDIPLVSGISIMSMSAYYYIPTEDTGLLPHLLQILSNPNLKIAGHNLKSDYYALLANGLGCADDFPSSEEAPRRIFHTRFDTAIAQYILEPSRSDYELKTLLMAYFHEEFPSPSEFLKENGQMDFLSESQPKYMEYGYKWCSSVSNLTDVLSEKLKAEDLEDVFTDIELPLIEVLASMETSGFAVDRKTLMDIGTVISKEIGLLTEKIYKLAGEEFNINSPLQLGIILFEKLGLPFGKKNKKGYATGVEILDKLKDDYEIVQLILDYRMYSKLNSTYIEGLLPLIHKDHKIHAHFQQTIAATGRISCTEPNLQNIPIKQEVGRGLRKAFITKGEEYTLVGADYSQIELRVLAHMAGDPALIEAFNKGQDIHRITASKVFEVPEDQVTPLQRSNAKAVNFGVIYGMSGFGLSTELNITRKEAEKYIDDYFKKYTRVKDLMDRFIAEGKQNGYVTTIMKRKRFINEINASNYMVRQAGERLAMNSPIQGSAADIIKLAMIKVYEKLRAECPKSQLILQVHDELIIEAHKDELEKVQRILTESMETAVDLKVALSVDLNTGNNWYDLK